MSKKTNQNITCRVLGSYELRKYEYYMRERTMDSRSMYFGCIISDDSITQLVDRMISDSKNHYVIVAEDDRMEIIGTVHIAISGDDEAELGIMISESYRGKGISNKLMDYAINWCRNRNHTSITMFCLSYNAPILHIVKKYGLEISSQLGSSEAKVILPRANIFTLGRENLANQQAILKQNIMSFKRLLSVA